MKPTNQPGESEQPTPGTAHTEKSAADDPKKPGYDPDQTPEKEIKQLPKAQPDEANPPKKPIGY